MTSPTSVKTEDQGTYHHVRITGPYSEAHAVLDLLSAKNAQIIRSGPYTNQKMHPKVDPTRFLILAHIPVNQ